MVLVALKQVLVGLALKVVPYVLWVNLLARLMINVFVRTAPSANSKTRLDQTLASLALLANTVRHRHLQYALLVKQAKQAMDHHPALCVKPENILSLRLRPVSIVMVVNGLMMRRVCVNGVHLEHSVLQAPLNARHAHVGSILKIMLRHAQHAQQANITKAFHCLLNAHQTHVVATQTQLEVQHPWTCALTYLQGTFLSHRI